MKKWDRSNELINKNIGYGLVEWVKVYLNIANIGMNIYVHDQIKIK